MFQLFGCRRADRQHHSLPQRLAQLLVDSYLLGYAKQMDDLYCGHKQHHIDHAVQQAQNTLPQGLQILRQRPLVDGYLRQFAAPTAQLCQQLWVRCPVLLHRHAHLSQRVAIGRINCL